MFSQLRRRGVLAASVVAVSALALSACGDSSDALDTTPEAGASSAPADTITVGSANFPENVLLAEMYAGALEAKGVKVSKKLNIGSREIYIPAIQDGSIDLLPEYNGALLSYFVKEPKATDPEGVYTEVTAALPDTLSLLEQSAAEDKDTLTVSKETADKLALTSITDLKGKAQDLTIGAGPEFRTRRAGLVGLESVYGLTFKAFKPLDTGGPLSVGALADGSVDVANIFSTDSAIQTNGFVSLEDPENLFLAQNIVPLINKGKVTPAVTEALDGVSKVLTTENLTEYLAKVQVDKADPATVAKEFLTANGLA